MEFKRNYRVKKLIYVFLFLTVLLGVFWWISRGEFWQREGKPLLSVAKKSYYCPMHPHIVSPKKGSCPICGMDLILQENSESPNSFPSQGTQGTDATKVPEAPESGNSFYVSLDRQQKIGVRLEKVRKRILFKSIKAPGRIAFDPELYTVQGEYIEALKQWRRVRNSPLKEVHQSTREMIRSAKIRLKILGLSDEEIAKLSRKKNQSEGLLISVQGQKKWIYAQVFEMDLPYLRKGLKVDVSAPFLGGEVLGGEVVSMDRVINPRTRTAKVRIQLTQVKPLLQLRPEAYVDVKIRIPMGKHFSVSREAIMDTGAGTFVFVKKGDGLFEPQQIPVLFLTEDYAGLGLGSLREGDQVVVGGNFMLDSASRLKSILRKKNPPFREDETRGNSGNNGNSVNRENKKEGLAQ